MKKKIDPTENGHAGTQPEEEQETGKMMQENAENIGDTEEKYKKEAAEWQDKYVRLYAEFDNFRKRTQKERIDVVKAAGKEILTALLPVLDDFDRAAQSIEQASDIQAIKEGVQLIHSKFKNILTQQGLREMDSKGQSFDTDLHEAITNVPAPAEDLKGKVVEELEKGYYLHDKVIRFAKVIVGA